MRKYIVFLCAGLLSGCAAAALDPYYYSDTVNYTNAYAYDDAYWYSGIYGYYPAYVTRDDAQAAANAAANAGQFFSPAGCATPTASGNTMTVTFANCTGPMGLSGVNGSISIAYQTSTSPGTLTLTSQNLTASNGAQITLSSTASYTISGNTVALTTQSASSVKTAAGVTITRIPSPSTLVFTQGSQCFTQNGQEQFTINGNPWSGVVSNFNRCLGQCPASGTFTLTPPNGDTVTITYNGSTDASITRKSGPSSTVALTCN
jgi:hypothetical protein